MKKFTYIQLSQGSFSILRNAIFYLLIIFFIMAIGDALSSSAAELATQGEPKPSNGREQPNPQDNISTEAPSPSDLIDVINSFPAVPPSNPSTGQFDMLRYLERIKAIVEQDIGGNIDGAVHQTSAVNCGRIVRAYTQVTNRPSSVQLPPHVEQVLSDIEVGVRDMNLNCKSIILQISNGPIPPLQWQMARRAVDDASNKLHQFIQHERNQ